MKEYIEKSEAVERALYTPIMSSGPVEEKDIDAWTDGAADAQEQIAKSIGKISAADVVERKRGEWVDISQLITDPDGDWIATQYQCSLCGRKEYRKEPFCNCGADMRGEKHEP